MKLLKAIKIMVNEFEDNVKHDTVRQKMTLVGEITVDNESQLKFAASAKADLTQLVAATPASIDSALDFQRDRETNGSLSFTYELSTK